MADRKKTIAVTGALGHIGSRLIREVDAQLVGEIRMMDNLESQRYCSLMNLPDQFRYSFVHDDIRTADLKAFVAGCDAVIHLAALTNAEASHDREKEVEEINLTGLKRVADACRETGVKLLFPSTTSVYGSQAVVVDETCAELKPQSPYAEAKLSAEQYLRDSARLGLASVTCRFGTIFGPSIGMRFHTAVNKFIWQALTGQPLTVWKTAWDQRRPYLDLSDCVAAINFILRRDLFDGQIYNVLTKNFTVEEIVETIRSFIPNLKVSFVESAIMNQLSYDVDDRKFRSLGFTPSGDLRTGVGDSIERFKAVKQAS